MRAFAPFLPPFAPCLRKYSRASADNFLAIKNSLTRLSYFCKSILTAIGGRAIITYMDLLKKTIENNAACERILGRKLTNQEYAWLAAFVGKISNGGR